MRILFVAWFFSTAAWGAACCLGGSPSSFISLQRLEKYEVGLSTTGRDVYGQYNLYGELQEASKNQTLTLALGAGAHVTEDLETSVVLPFQYQRSGSASRTSLADTIFTFRYLLLENLFQEDVYPTVTLHAGVKVPSGKIESTQERHWLPGTGNGQWEPFVGVNLAKPFRWGTFSVQTTFTKRIASYGISDGDNIELVEALSLPITNRLAVAGGATQAWTLASSVDGRTVPDSHMRIATLFIGSTYFLTREWSMSGSFNFAIPIDRFGLNQSAARALTFTTRYGFF